MHWIAHEDIDGSDNTECVNELTKFSQLSGVCVAGDPDRLLGL